MAEGNGLTDRDKLSGLFSFAQGVLAAKSSVLMRMQDTGVGYFPEADIYDLPGVHFAPDLETWMRLDRLRETPPPKPDAMLGEWLDSRIDNPSAKPGFKAVVIREAEIEEVSDLCEAGLLDMDDVHPFHEEGMEGDLKLQVLEHFADPMPEGRAYSGQSILEQCQSDLERDVCVRLIDANYRVRSQVKAGPYSIDLVVEGVEDRRLAIELDGDFWHGPEKWEQDMARQAALERAGWTFWRVFGSQWVSEKEHWWKNLADTLGAMGIEPLGIEASEESFTEFRAVDVSVGLSIDPNKDARDLEDEDFPLTVQTAISQQSERPSSIVLGSPPPRETHEPDLPEPRVSTAQKDR